MRISVKGEYALKAIFDLALHSPGESVKIAGISKRQRIPRKFLESILAGLKQGGFVESRRGAGGGYLLARPADAIAVGEVLRFVEGPRAPKTQSARRKSETPFAEMWWKVDQAVSSIIDHTTFAELTRDWAERQGRYVPNWEI
jgi:Rrf2 family transcriptional regulator, cysteine metabolism repressor